MALTKATYGMISADTSTIDLNIDANTLYVDSSANRVGIGTTSPNAPLDVSATATTSTDIAYFSNSNNVRKAKFHLAGDGSGILSLLDGSNNTDILISATGDSYFNSGGDIGIGTTSPNSRLHISHATAPNFRLSRTDIGQVWVQSIDSSGRLHIAEAASEGGTQYSRLVIDDTGEVGIGTSSPRHKLSVNGTLGSSTFSGFGLGVIGGLATAESGTPNAAIGLQCASASSSKIFAYDYANSAAVPISIQPDNANVFICAGGGNVGIGTTSPATRLHVSTSGSSIARFERSGSAVYQLTVTDGGAGAAQLYFQALTNDTGYNFQTKKSDGNAVDTLFMAPTGTVGVGTTNPLTHLDVVRGGTTGLSSVNARTVAIFQNNNSAGSVISVNAKNTGYSGIFLGDEDGEATGQIKQLHTNNSMEFTTTGGAAMMTLNSSGNLGIGTSPTARLSVNGVSLTNVSTTGIPAIRAQGGYGGGIGLLDTKEAGWYQQDNGDTLYQYVGRTVGSDTPASKVVVTYKSTGRVGIGTSAPSYQLHQSGTIADQAPLHLMTVSGTPANTFNWVSEAMAANLGQDKRITHAFGKARSNGDSGTMSFVPRASSANNAITFGLFGQNDILNICYSGKVGVGITTPFTPFHVNTQGAPDTSGNVTNGLAISDGTGGNVVKIGVHNSGALNYLQSGYVNNIQVARNFALFAGATEAMRVSANANVGIGTTSDTYDFQVRGGNSATNGHMVYFENNAGGGNGCTFSVQHTNGNHSWGIVQELRIQNGSGTDNPSLLFSSGTESTKTWSVGYGFTDDNFRIKKDHGYHNGGWGTSLFTLTRSGNLTISGSLTENSDERLKENIEVIPNALNKVKEIRGVTFDWKDSTKGKSMGVIAQEVEKVSGLEMLISECPKDGSDEMEVFQPKGVAYQNMVGLLIEAIKELESDLKAAKTRISELESK